MKNLFSILFVFCINFASSSCVKPSAEDSVDRLLNKIEINLVEKYNLKCIGDAIGMPGGIVQMLGLRFELKGPLTKDQIRAKLIQISQDFVRMVNEDHEIRPYLKRVPFEIEDLDLGFFIVDNDNNNSKYPRIRIAGIYKGDFSYTTFLMPNSNDRKYERETYEEALKALEKTSQQDKPVSSSVKNETS